MNTPENSVTDVSFDHLSSTGMIFFSDVGYTEEMARREIAKHYPSMNFKITTIDQPTEWCGLKNDGVVHFKSVVEKDSGK